MRIKFVNGVELTPILVTGAQVQVQGTKRDTLTFTFSANEDMATLDSLFTANNCETLIIFNNIDGSENIHKAYTIRHELKKTTVMVTPAAADTEAVYEDRITVSMAQRTYAESQLASLTETIDILVMENLMA